MFLAFQMLRLAVIFLINDSHKMLVFTCQYDISFLPQTPSTRYLPYKQRGKDHKNEIIRGRHHYKNCQLLAVNVL